MEMYLILIALVIGIGVSVKLMPLLVHIATMMKVVIAVLFQFFWVVFLLVTAVAILSFWNIGLEFSGLTLITAVAGLIFVIWTWGKTQRWESSEY